MFKGAINKINFKMLFLLITIILILILAVKTVTALTHNHKLTKDYSLDPEAYNYKDALIDGKIDIKEVEKLFPSIEAAIAHDHTNIVNVPITISYYHAIGDSSPAYVIDKGERIHVRKDSNSLSVKVGYGLDSMPTDVEGWRIAYPFSTDTGLYNELFYVRIDELSEVARSWVDTNDSLLKKAAHPSINADDPLVKRVYQAMQLTKNNIIRGFTLLVDHKLYDSGVYLSPDLFFPVFPISSIIISAMAILSAGTWMFLCKAKK